MKRPGTKATDDGREDQKPWDKWFWQDYEADVGLRASSLNAQGLWMRTLGYMARAKKKGYLLDGEKQMESKTLAKLVGITTEFADELLSELGEHQVYSRTPDGTIYNRRMVREADLSKIRSECGRLGGRPKKQNESKPKARSAYASAYASSLRGKERSKGKRGGGNFGSPVDPDDAALDKALKEQAEEDARRIAELERRKKAKVIK